MRTSKIIFILLFVSFSIHILGCDVFKPRFFIVMIDETESFNEDTTNLSEIITHVTNIVNKLKPGDGFAVIGIDEHGSDPDDVRIKPIILDEGTLTAQKQKVEIINKVRGFTPREIETGGTDILQALFQVAGIIKNNDKHQGSILIFSDMVQDPPLRNNEPAKDLIFLKDTKVFCFYVNVTQYKADTTKLTEYEWFVKIVNSWTPIFDSARLKYKKNGEKQFYTKENTPIGLEKIFLQ